MADLADTSEYLTAQQHQNIAGLKDQNQAKRFMAQVNGFTLIELLVVMSIIALLISILLPFLSTARHSAQGAVCASNMRQLGIANASYTLDHKGQYCPYGLTGAHAAQWTELLSEYMQRGSENGDTFNTATGGGQAFKCPSDTQAFPTLYGQAVGADHVGESSGWLSYTMNSGPITYTNGEKTYSGVGGNMVDDIRHASQTMHHADVAYIRYIADIVFLTLHPQVNNQFIIATPDPRSHYGPSAPISAGAHTSAHEQLMSNRANVYRHNDRMNLLFADGHVDTSIEQIPSAEQDRIFWGQVYMQAD